MLQFQEIDKPRAVLLSICVGEYWVPVEPLTAEPPPLRPRC